MNKVTARKIVNWTMRVSLIVVLVTGMLLHPLGGNMWLGISHGVSGFVLTGSIIVHCFQHRRKRKAA